MSKITEETKEAEKYKFEPYEDSPNELIKLSKKNVGLIEAMIKIDSAYAKAGDKESGPKGKYKGSTAYWFDKLKQGLENIKENKKLKDVPTDKEPVFPNDAEHEKVHSKNKLIYEVVCAVDRENSTHLNADGIGRDEIAGRIEDYTKKGFFDALKNPYDEKKGLELIEVIKKKTNPESDRKGRVNLSFASKFCHNACYYLFEEDDEKRDNFPLYDTVIKSVLPRYAEYFNCEIEDKEFKIYSKYVSLIEEIIKASGNEISKQGFDHLLWYYYKGRNLSKSTSK